MAEISRNDLFAKLSPLAFKSLESATMLAKMRSHSLVELPHWFLQILQSQDSDLHRLVRHFELDASRLAADLTEALERLPAGGSSMTDLSGNLEDAVERGWLYASLLFRSTQVRSGHLIVGCLKTPVLRNQLLGVSQQFSKLKLDALTDSFHDLLAGSPEHSTALNSGATTGQSSTSMSNHSSHATPGVLGGTAGLTQYTTDLTAAARNGELDPVIGRGMEIRGVIDVLLRRRQNNPILTGEAGVGKTAVVEGFALRIAAGDVPPALQNVRLLALDVGLLQAGASMKGEFEQRLRQVIDEVQASPEPIVLFIDEAHTLLGGGSPNGPGDAANLLKPTLARGSLRTIAATTWSEYKRYIEKDPALTRRFQVIKVEQPDLETAVRMLRPLTSTLQEHHGVRILDEAVRAAVELSSRYVPDRKLPDKAISLLDTAAARVAVSQHAVPARVDDCRKQVESLEVEADIARRELTIDESRAADLQQLEQQLGTVREQLGELESRWESELGLVQTLLSLRQEMSAFLPQPPANAGQLLNASVEPAAEAIGVARETLAQAADDSSRLPSQAGYRPPPLTNHAEADSVWSTQIDTWSDDADAKAFPLLQLGDGFSNTHATDLDEPAQSASAQTGQTNLSSEAEERMQTLQNRLAELQDELRDLQGDEPLVLATVDQQAVAAVVADWTGVPVGRMVTSQIESVLTLDETLSARVVGQDHAMQSIARRIQTSRAGLDDPEKPVGVFLLAGPSGVGKTETAIALAETLFGGTQNLIAINMSEFQEAHTVSTLKGAPPGYVGYGEGGVLTEAVRRKPYSVLLLDEVEKAHPDTHEIFFQVFDKGRMEDGEGRSIDFKNTLILLTSNVGSDVIMRQCQAGRCRPDDAELLAALRPYLVQVFPPALLGRMVTIPYYPLGDDNLAKIISLKMKKIEQRIMDTYAAKLIVPDAVLALIGRRCTEVESGGRMIDAILTNTVLPEISRRVLRAMADQTCVQAIRLSVESDRLLYDVETTPRK